MTSGEVRKVSRQDLQFVQNLIESCLNLYMNQKEVVDALSFQAKIEPSFTELVWQKLEEQNQEFFKAYHVRLMLKNQILVFNKLLEKQVELMHTTGPAGAALAPPSNGSLSAWHAPPPASPRPDQFFCNGVSNGPVNGRSLGQEGNCVGNGSSILTVSMDTSASMLSTQNSNIGRTIEMNGTTIKTEPVYSSSTEFPFCSDSSFLEAAHQPVGDASAGSLSSSEYTGSDPLLDIDTSSFGFSQIPRNFSFSDLTDDFTQCADILENYGRSPFLSFLPGGATNFQDSPGREFNDEESKRLDTISEGVCYDDFGSDC